MDKQNKWAFVATDPWWNYKRMRNKWEWMRIAVTQKYCMGERVLEMGCGNGDLYSYVASYGVTIYGVDISPVAIRMAKAKCLELGLTGRFACCDSSDIPLSDSIFDVVILPEIVEHVDDPIPILKEAKRLCKLGGRIVITVPNENLIPDPAHKIIFTKDSLVMLAHDIFDDEAFFIDEIPSQWLGIYVTNNKNQTANKLKTADSVRDELDRFFAVVNPEPIDISEKVSLIIPTYNREKYIISSLESVFNQTYKNIEIIIVNDGSTDSTEKLLEPYFHQVRYIKQENAGKSVAVNKGLDIATGNFIWVMDDDDIAHPMKVEIQVRSFRKNPHIGLISTEMLIIDEDNRIISYLANPVIENKENTFELLLQSNIFYGPPVIVRRECYEKVGKWDTDLVRSVDYEMWLRIVKDYDAACIHFPTICLRAHKGMRGSKTDCFPASSLKEKWKEYDKVIFTRVYNRYSVKIFYKPVEIDQNHLIAQAIAYYERAYVMFKHELYELAKNDIHMVCDLIERMKDMYLYPEYIEKYFAPFFERIKKFEVLAKQGKPAGIRELNKKIKEEFLKSYDISINRKIFNEFSRLSLHEKGIQWKYLFNKRLQRYILWAFFKKIVRFFSRIFSINGH